MSEVIIERTFKADPDTVFAYITKTENLIKWWGPEGITIPEHKLDFTKLGYWTSTMEHRDGKCHKVSGEVLSIDKPNTVEFTWRWHDENDIRGHESRVRFEVRKNQNGGTQFIMTHAGLESDEFAQKHNQGWNSTFNKLDLLDEEMTTRSSENA